MTGFLITIVLAGITLALYLLYTSLAEKKKKKEWQRMVRHFNRLGSSHGLRFSNREVLHEAIIGIDAEQHKILILKKRGSHNAVSRLIELSELKSCSVFTHYGTYAGSHKKALLSGGPLESIALGFVFHDGKTEELVFYHHRINPLMEITSLANKAVTGIPSFTDCNQQQKNWLNELTGYS